MTQECTARFLPDQTEVQVAPGTTILQAAQSAGVFVNCLCGGDGVCGRCRVRVTDGQAVGESTEFFTREEIREGYILACEARIESDVTVELPGDHRLGEGLAFAERDVPHLADLSKLIQYIRLKPLVRKIHFEVPAPSLENNLSDLQRLEHELSRQLPDRPLQMGLKVMRNLPRVLRNSGGKVTAVTGYRGAVREVLDVEAGDTTRRNMCIAADIGTTTVVCQLVDLRDGQTLGQAAKYNSQINFGADVIRRIIYASQSRADLHALREAIVDDLNELIHELLSRHRMGPRDISLVSVAGNTTMLHLLLGLPADNIRKEPFAGAAYAYPAFRAVEIGLKIHPRGLLYCLPCVAAFVGGDVVSGVFATAMAHGEDVRMLIDIGTNGEVVIGNRDFLVCASASAGPAFEGAECTSGMRATRGAVDHISLMDGEHVLSYSTISSAPPAGLCGTGYVDLIAEMLRVGVIDRTGRLQPDAAPGRIRQSERGEMLYEPLLAHETGSGTDVVVTQADIDNICRAKGAIYAAETVLLRSLDMTLDNVSEIMVAGAFGNFLNIANAVAIGLLPDVSPERMRFVGNVSLAGAKLAALSDVYYREICDIAPKMTYFELGTSTAFMDEFVSACFFPHTDLSLFPSVAEPARPRG